MVRQRIETARRTRTWMDGQARPAPRPPASEGRPSGFARIFAVPEGEPVDRLLIVEELGLRGPRAPVLAGVWTDFDLEIGNGRVIWAS